MPCKTFSGSHKKPCLPSIAGLKAVSFGLFDPLNRIVTTDTGVVTIAAQYAVNTLARFDVKNTTTKYDENATKGADTNSKSIAGTLPLVLSIPPNAADHIAIAKVADTFMDREWVAFLEYKDNTVVAIGSQFGADILSYTGSTGGTGEELNGYTINITTNENEDSRKYTLTGAGLTSYATALMAVV